MRTTVERNGVNRISGKVGKMKTTSSDQNKKVNKWRLRDERAFY